MTGEAIKTSRDGNDYRGTSPLTRRDFVLRSATYGAAALLAPQLIPDSAAAKAKAATPLRPESCAPVLYWTGKQEVTLAWPVAGLSQGWVEYGPTPKMGRKAVAGEDVPDFVGGFTAIATRSELKALAEAKPDVLKARLKELTPGQCIYYRVHSQQSEGKGSPTTGDVRKFTLPDPAAPETSIAVWNDTHDHHDTLRALHKLSERS
jgi:hypothetical protein